MTSPIDVAKVEIQADTSQFPGEVDRGVSSAMKTASAIVDATVASIEAAFAELADGIAIAFDDVQANTASALRDVAADGEFATSVIQDEFAVMGERVDAIFNEMQHAASTNFDQIEAKAVSTGGVMKGALGSVAAGVGLAGAAVGTGLGLLAGFGLKSAANLEQVQIAFESLTGSVAAGKAQFQDLQKFAAATPFEFKDLTTAAQRFDAFSASIGQSQQQLIPFLTTIGNLVSETGGGAQALDSISLALGQTASQGKLTLGNLNQINNAIPGFSSVAALAAVRGESTAQVMQEISSGSIDAKTGINQLLVGMQKFPGAAGAMDKQAQTLLGVFSTFKDTVSQTLSNAFQPVIPAIKDTLTQLTPIIGDALKTLAPALGTVITGLLKVAGPLVSALSKILTPILDALGPVIGSLAPAITELGTAFGEVATALTPILPVLGQVVGVLAIGLAKALEAVAPVLGQLADAFVKLAPTLIPFIAQLANEFTTSLAPVLQAMGPTINILAVALNDILTAIQPLLPILVPLVEVWVAWNAALALFDILMDANPIGLVVIAVGLLIVALVEVLKHWHTIVNFLEGIWGPIVGFFGRTIDSVVNFFTRLPGRVLGEVTRLKNTVMGFFSGAIGWLLNAGHDVIFGLIHGIENSVGDAIHAVQNAMGSVVHGALSALGINSPSKVFMEIGHSTVEGYTKGVDDHAHMALTSVTNLVAPPRGAAAGGGGGGGGVVFHAGAIMVAFNGAVPTQQEALATGQAVGNGIAQRLAARKVNSTVRAL